MTAALALGDALGVSSLAMAELLPVIEAVMVAKLNKQMEQSDGGKTGECPPCGGWWPTGAR